MFSLFKPFIFKIDPEMAHDLAIKSLKYNFLPAELFKVKNEEILETEIFKTKIKNPIGLAAGFDKSAEVYNSLFRFGFGFIEVGTVTPKKQFGNPKPRIFRLENDRALINRLGFNNDGLEKISKRLYKNSPNGFLGINIGPNKDSENRVDDYLKCLKEIYSFANYITVNISSPNTPGLRDFHNESTLQNLLKNITEFAKKNKIYQIATDCVYDGSSKLYSESSPHNPLDVYGKTKSLGEVQSGNFFNIRVSIIGKEISKKIQNGVFK